MALDKVDRETYDRVVNSNETVNVVSKKLPDSIYYKSQMVFDKEDRLIALHNEDGELYADLSILNR